MDERSGMQSGDMQFSFTSLDDFTHLSADKYMSSSFNKSQYSQVIFHNLIDIYPTDSDIKCTYTLTDNVKPQAGDKIAIFKVGWLSVSDYIAFIRAQVPENPENSVLEVTFKAGTFPKKDNELYQLCYVTSGNVIAGASTPFSFLKPHESEFVAIEDPTDPCLVVFRSRVAQLQSDLEKKNEENESLITRCHVLEERCNILKKELDKCEIELSSSKIEMSKLLEKQEELIDQKNKDEEKESLITKCQSLEERNILLHKELEKCGIELSSSKKEISQLLEKQEELIGQKNELEKCLSKCNEEICSLKQEKNCYEFLKEDFERKIEVGKKTCEQLMEKLERVDNEKDAAKQRCIHLNETVENLNEKSKSLKTKLNILMEYGQKLEGENQILQEKLKEQEMKSIEESTSCKNQIPFEVYIEGKNELEKEKMKVESLSMEKERLEGTLREQSLSNDNLILEIRNLTFKIKEMSEKHNKAMAESHSLNATLNELKQQNQKLTNDLVECRNALNEDSQSGQQFLKCKEEKELYEAQLENLDVHYTNYKKKKQIEIDELKKIYELEKFSVIKENGTLKAKMQKLEQKLKEQQPSTSSGQKSNGQFKDPASQLFEVFHDACSHVQSVFDVKLPKMNQNEADTEQNVESDKNLKEKLKCVLNQRAEISENLIQERHKNTELERVLVEIKEENAALKSRISVLEIELATMKNTSKTSASFASSSPTCCDAHSLISEQLDSLNKSIPVITEFNKIVAEQKVLEQKIQQEKEAKITLQEKVEFLLEEDAKMSNELREITGKYEKLLKEHEDLSKSVQAESIEVLQKLLEDNDCTISKLRISLADSIRERDRLSQSLNELRKEFVGKITVNNLAEYKTQIQQLQEELQKKTKESRFMAKFIQDRFSGESNRIISCPICPAEFPSTSREGFVQHFDGHMS